METLLVTGGAGFIGCNFVRHILQTRPHTHIVTLDALTYAGSIENLKDVQRNPRHTFAHGDITDAAGVEALFSRYRFDAVIHFAAHTHVDNSIRDPQAFLRTNVLGTQTLLEQARKSWLDEGGYRRGVRFLQVSTDEVYGALGNTGAFSEESPPAPNNPYAASKASADFFARAYGATYGLPVVITRSSNNYGPYQLPEKLIPLMITNAMQNRPLPLYGDGLQRRDWLHVRDHCAALAAALEGGTPGEVYNIGGDSEKTNLELARLVLAKLNKPQSLIRFVADRPGHDRRYAMDHTKITTALGWRPRYSFERGLEETIAWYAENTLWLQARAKARFDAE